jgi:hypothetical protein
VLKLRLGETCRLDGPSERQGYGPGCVELILAGESVLAEYNDPDLIARGEAQLNT